MKQKSNVEALEKPETRISFRLDEHVARRFERIVTASKRSKTSIIEECLEVALPKLEKQYAE